MRRPALPALLVLALLSLSCDGNSGVTTGGRGALGVTCETAGGTVPAGSATGLPVTFLVTRGGAASGGESVVFTASAGDVIPDVVLTAADGTATATFLPPAGSGTVLLTGRVTVPGDEAFATCSATVTGSANPRLSVSVVSPASLAGLTIRVGYDGAVLRISSPGIESTGPLATANCVSQSTDTGSLATLLQACDVSHFVVGAEVGRFTFANSGPVQDAADFTVTCEGVDVSGNAVATFCSFSVTQL